MFYSPDLTGRILSAIESIMLGNNGYADIGNNPEVAEAVRKAGYVVLASTNLHGNPTFKGYTKAAQIALRGEPYAVSTYKPVPYRQDEPDYEGAILARQENAGFYD